MQLFCWTARHVFHGVACFRGGKRLPYDNIYYPRYKDIRGTWGCKYDFFLEQKTPIESGHDTSLLKTSVFLSENSCCVKGAWVICRVHLAQVIHQVLIIFFLHNWSPSPQPLPASADSDPSKLLDNNVVNDYSIDYTYRQFHQ